MRTLFPLLFLLLSTAAFAQIPGHVEVYPEHRPTPAPVMGFNPAQQPFYHGVASGDPLADAVIIWTRVTPDSAMTITGTWEMATDSGMVNMVQSGYFTTDASRDYTVKIDVTGLQSNTSYYYRFNALGRNSITGRTKTAPTGNEEEHLRFAVVSCQNYQAGYYNAHAEIAARNDLHAVVHLGDYIYEYPGYGYGDTSLTQRQHDSSETVTLEQYRTRYSLYRLDRDLMRAHQQHPFISIWDDHETANNAWMGGAGNHNPATEGDWFLRKSAGKQAYFEWQPIRDNADTSIYRVMHYGDLCDLIMLDTRLEGREQQVLSVTDPTLYDPARTMLGVTQDSWFRNALNNSTARWKVVGNQVIFAEFNVGWLGPLAGQTPEQAESAFLDIWDGYPEERLSLIHFIDSANIDNTVFLTGDVHTSFAFDVADTVADVNNNYAPIDNYDRLTGAGSKAVEFVTPSITSANFDENFDQGTSDLLEVLLLQPVLGAPAANYANPHLKFADLDRHGYVLLDLKPDSAQGNWFFVNRIDTPALGQSFAAAEYTLNGQNHLRPAQQASPEKLVQDIPAPPLPALLTGIHSPSVADVALLGLYPNPASDFAMLQYALSSPSKVRINLYNMSGQKLFSLFNEQQAQGVYLMRFPVENLAAGNYVVRIETGNGGSVSHVLVVL